MIARLIRRSVHNRFLVLVGALMVSACSVYATLNTPLDALPDLSDTQEIVRTTYPGQAPQGVEDQMTYPLTTTLLSVPHAKPLKAFNAFPSTCAIHESCAIWCKTFATCRW